MTTRNSLPRWLIVIAATLSALTSGCDNSTASKRFFVGMNWAEAQQTIHDSGVRTGSTADLQVFPYNPNGLWLEVDGDRALWVYPNEKCTQVQSIFLIENASRGKHATGGKAVDAHNIQLRAPRASGP